MWPFSPSEAQKREAARKERFRLRSIRKPTPVGVPPESVRLRHDETELLEELRQLMREKSWDPPALYLKCFMRSWALPHGVETAGEEMVKAMEFRKKMNVDTILDTDFDKEHLLNTLWPKYFYGKDKYGHPVLYHIAPDGKDEIFSHFTKENIEKMHIRMMERGNKMLEKWSEETGVETYRYTQVYDVAKIGMYYRKYMDPIKWVMNDISQMLYPDTVCRIFIVNAPAVFRMVWSVIKCWFCDDMKERMIILDASYLEKLTEHIDLTEIPPHFGGLGKNAPIPGCWSPSGNEWPLPMQGKQEAAGLR